MFSHLLQTLAEEEFKGEGLELDLVSAMKELGIQDRKIFTKEQPSDSGPDQPSSEFRESCKVSDKSSCTHRSLIIVCN